MQESFAKAKTFSARFEKQLYWAVLDKTLSQKGRIYTRKPGKFRVEVEGGSVEVADGAGVPGAAVGGLLIRRATREQVREAMSKEYARERLERVRSRR